MPVSKSRKKKDSSKASTRPSATAKPESLAIYHVAYEHEDFDTTADILFQLVKRSAAQKPGTARHLYLDIEGHQNPMPNALREAATHPLDRTPYDRDMSELVGFFIPRYLSRWLTSYSAGPGGERITTTMQHEDLPQMISILPGGKSAERVGYMTKSAKDSKAPVYDADTDNTYHPDGTTTPGMERP